MDICTINLTGSPLTILPEDGVYRLSVKAVGGPVGITGFWIFTPSGGATKGTQYPSTQIQLAVGEGIVLEGRPNKGIKVIIDPLAAAAEVMLFFS